MVFTHRSFADMFAGFVLILFYSLLRLYYDTFGLPSIYGGLSGDDALWNDAGWSNFFTFFLLFAFGVFVLVFCFEELKGRENGMEWIYITLDCEMEVI